MEEIALGLGLTILLLSFTFECVDSSLGMGYGTSLTPLLLALGFEPADIVPAILISELVTGILASIFHHRQGNANFLPDVSGLYMPDALRKIHTTDGLAKAYERTPRDLKVGILLSIASAVGALISAYVSVSLSADAVRIYIGTMVTIIGIVILLKRSHEYVFSWKKVSFLGTVAAFNKGISGGGYGPVVTSGQLLSGVNPKSAIAITSFAEFVACAVGAATYFALGKQIFTPITLYLVGGAVLSAPLSAYVVSKIRTKNMAVLVGVVTLILGIYTLLRVFSLI